jgi:hypothetical protein
MNDDLNTIMESFMFQLNTEGRRTRLINSFQNYLESQRGNGMIYDYHVIDRTTMEDIDNNNIHMEITYQPTPTPNFITMDIISNSNVEKGFTIEPRKTIKKHIL